MAIMGSCRQPDSFLMLGRGSYAPLARAVPHAIGG